MCHCVQTVRNFVRGRGKFNVYEEIISLQFTVHDTSHHLCKQCLRKLQKRRGLRNNLRELDQEILSSSHEIEKKTNLWPRRLSRSRFALSRAYESCLARQLLLRSRYENATPNCVRGTENATPVLGVLCIIGSPVPLIGEIFLRMHFRRRHTFASLWGACLRFASLWRANSRGDSCVLGVHVSKWFAKVWYS